MSGNEEVLKNAPPTVEQPTNRSVCGTIGIILTYLNSLNMFQDNNVAVTVGYMQMLFTGALLWGACGIIIGTPSQILNVGNVAPRIPS